MDGHAVPDDQKGLEMSNVASCNICAKQGKEFKVPWGDHVGPELMRAHFEEKHPEITFPPRKN
jgi:hypothetical protein